MSDPSLEKYDSIHHLPPRNIRVRWLQIHLSTAIVLMFVAGGLVWVNTRPRQWQPPAGYTASGIAPNVYGWPSYAYSSGTSFWRVDDERMQLKPENFSEKVWYWNGVLIDVACAAVILGVVIFISESLIRRREAGAP